MLTATSNGLRQQSVARRAEIKVSCIFKILPSVLLCRTLKPNGKFCSMGSTKTENESNSLSGSVINSAQSSGKKRKLEM